MQFTLKTLLAFALPFLAIAAPLHERGLFSLYSVTNLNSVIENANSQMSSILEAKDDELEDKLNDFHSSVKQIAYPSSGCLFCGSGGSTGDYSCLCDNLITLIKNCIQLIVCGIAAKKRFLCKIILSLFCKCCSTIVFVCEPLCYILPFLGKVIYTKICIIKSLLNELSSKVSSL